jgi:DNA invertase Pin-like site-specific DNA recombinase
METLLPQIAFGYGRVSTAKQGLSREAQTDTVQRAAAFYSGIGLTIDNVGESL